MDRVEHNISAVTLGFEQYLFGQHSMGDIKTKTISPLGK